MIEFSEESDLFQEGPALQRQKPLSTGISLSQDEMEQVLTYLVNQLWRTESHN